MGPFLKRVMERTSPAAILLMTVLLIMFTRPYAKKRPPLTNSADERGAVNARAASGFVGVQGTASDHREAENVEGATLAVGGVARGGIAARAAITAGGVIILEVCSAAPRPTREISIGLTF
jgi:hypothetical protein